MAAAELMLVNGNKMPDACLLTLKELPTRCSRAEGQRARQLGEK
jgi:hypothetical protein